MKRILLIQCATLFLLSSCSSTKDTWDCPILNGSATNCSPIKSSDTISREDSSTKNNVDLISSAAQKIEIKLIAPKLSDLKKVQKTESPIIQDSDSSSKLRTKEKVGKIWFAPHIDSDGNQHSEKTIFVVDEEAKWVGQK